MYPILLVYCMKQINFMSPWVCTVIDHRRHQNAVRKSVDYALYTSLLFLALCDLFCYLLQNRCQVTWCLSVKLILPGWALNCEFIPDFVSHNFVTFSGSRTGICPLRLHELLQMHCIFNLFQEALAMMSFQRCIFIPIQCFLSLLIIFTWLVSLELSQEEYLWVEKMAVFMK